MTNEQKRFAKLLAEHPEIRRPAYFRRPHWTRRNFFKILGSGVAGAYLAREAKAAACSSENVTTINKARNVIFILMAGAPSHVDTFDFKMTNGITPAAANPATVNGIYWPTGILPNLADHLGNIATNIGSIVALEKAAERKPSDVLPTFLGLNSDGAVGSGYLDATYAPFKYNPTTGGLPDTTNSFGQARFGEMLTTLHTEDDPLRINSPLGKPAEDMDGFYDSAKSLMYNPQVQSVFTYSAADSARYGNSSFGNALVIAKQAVAANMGTRFVQVTVGGWDMHVNIYGPNFQITQGSNIFTLGKTFDSALAALLSDLKGSGMLDSTLVIAMGEFGRTPNFTAAQGRDHYPVQFAMFAGGGVTGGKVIGQTSSDGSQIVDNGWSQNRPVNAEDIEATIYSAMGINWTNVCYNDPFHRGFEYVPQSNGPNYWLPINELFS